MNLKILPMAQKRRSAWVGGLSSKRSGASNDDFSDGSKSNRARDLKIILATFVVTAVLLVELINIFNWDLNFSNPSSSSSQSNTETSNTPVVPDNQSGNVALSAAQLKEEVAKVGVPVYWLGEESGAKYTLTVLNNGGQIFVRYLPDGKLPTNGTSTNRVISTYAYPNAFDTLKSASKNSADGVGVTGPNDSFIYYGKNKKTNVYVAFPKVDVQIEIYDPAEGTALKLANQKGLVQLVK